MFTQIDNILVLPDGRKLGYARYGDPDGVPVLYFTGGNSSRLEGQWFANAAEQAGIHLIVPDRPGFGLSDFMSGRKLVDWGQDVAALTAVLGIDRFSVFGLSGGGPHVLALLHTHAGLVKRAAVVSGTAPPEMPNKFKDMWPPVRAIFWTAKNWGGANRFLLRQIL